MKVAVLGGAGAMGSITARDVLETADRATRVLVCDYDLRAAESLVAKLEDGRAKAVPVDVRNAEKLASVIQGSLVVINCVQYQFNLSVMEVALSVGAHYVDLGGLFHVTRLQLAMHERFKGKGLTALVGMGAAPGITNILARHAADQMDTVREIHLRVGSIDQTRYTSKMALPVSYSIKTVLEEFSFPPAVFAKGKFRFVPPLSGDVPHRFPAPVGQRRPMHSIHSEVATLPLSYREKGVKEVTFKIAFDPEFLDRVRFLRDVGLASDEPIEVNGQKVAPIDVVNKVIMSQLKPKQIGKLKQHEILRAVVKGACGRKKMTHVVDCHTFGMPAWGIGLDIDTGAPPSIAAQMIAQGLITERGVVPPEVAVPPAPFFKELKRRRMTVNETLKNGWSFQV
jgi:lysine 6-dehydrogenase